MEIIVYFVTDMYNIECPTNENIDDYIETSTNELPEIIITFLRPHMSDYSAE